MNKRNDIYETKESFTYKPFNESLDDMLTEGFFDTLRNMFKADPPLWKDMLYAWQYWFDRVYDSFNYLYGVSNVVQSALTSSQMKKKIKWSTNITGSMDLPGFKPLDTNLLDKLLKEHQHVCKMIMKDPLSPISVDVKLSKFTGKNATVTHNNTPNDMCKQFDSKFRQKMIDLINLNDTVISYVAERNKNVIINDPQGMKNLNLLYVTTMNLNNYLIITTSNWLDFINAINNEYPSEIKKEVDRRKNSSSQSRGLVSSKNILKDLFTQNPVFTKNKKYM